MVNATLHGGHAAVTQEEEAAAAAATAAAAGSGTGAGADGCPSGTSMGAVKAYNQAAPKLTARQRRLAEEAAIAISAATVVSISSPQQPRPQFVANQFDPPRRLIKLASRSSEAVLDAMQQTLGTPATRPKRGGPRQTAAALSDWEDDEEEEDDGARGGPHECSGAPNVVPAARSAAFLRAQDNLPSGPGWREAWSDAAAGGDCRRSAPGRLHLPLSPTVLRCQ